MRGRGGRINPMVPGHRDLYKEAGITKQQTKAGSTRYNQQTPEQEHQSRADGTTITRKKQTEELVLDEQKMKELMDWMWRTRHNKQGDEDKLWAPAAEIPKQLRPKLNQLMQCDWSNSTPYPGWVLAVEQGCSGWKCKLMTDEELRVYNTGIGKSRNPKSIKRANEVVFASVLRAENAEAEIARRRLSEPSSSSGVRQDRASGAENRPLQPLMPKMNLRLKLLKTERPLQPLMQKTRVLLKVSYQMTIFAQDAWMNLVYLWKKSTKQCCHYLWKLEFSRMAMIQNFWVCAHQLGQRYQRPSHLYILMQSTHQANHRSLFLPPPTIGPRNSGLRPAMTLKELDSK